MQYELILTGKFKKSLKLAKKRGLDLKILDKVITMLQNDISLEEKYRDTKSNVSHFTPEE